MPRLKNKRYFTLYVIILLTYVLSACRQSNDESSNLDSSKSPSIQSSLTLVTWNAEHLAFPLSQGCNPRGEAEQSKLKQYADNLQADIVALQEVASIQAVEQLFPSDQWQIYISDRADSKTYVCRGSGTLSTQQKVAFAVRNSIKVKRLSSLPEFGLNNIGLRYGLEMTIDSPWGDITLLNLHLKSGCFVSDFSTSKKKACKEFAKQAAILDQWIEHREKRQTPYVVFGDFNHRLSESNNQLTQVLTKNSDNSESSLNHTTELLAGCHPYYPLAIDHILVGQMHDSMFTKSAFVYPYKQMKPELMLSDHCAVTVILTSKVKSFR